MSFSVLESPHECELPPVNAYEPGTIIRCEETVLMYGRNKVCAKKHRLRKNWLGSKRWEAIGGAW